MKHDPLRTLAVLVLHLARSLMPPPMRPWGQAMFHEGVSIDRPGAALFFALGCLGCAARQAAVHHLLHAFTQKGVRSKAGTTTMAHALRQHPRGLAALCALIAAGLGLIYLNLAQAPFHYAMVNTLALGLGFFVLTMLALLEPFGERSLGRLNLALGVLLLSISIFGVQVEGATRWITLGGVSIQPSLILLPGMAMIFAHNRDTASTLGMVLAGAGLALQPDRAMSAALAAAMTALVMIRPDRATLAAFAASALGFAVTLARPDALPAAPFVDRIFYTAFEVHPLASVAVLGGAAVMLAPAVIGWFHDPVHRQVHAVFGAVWLVIVLAAALGNYPTPLVGYGASAILGYTVSLLGLPRIAGTIMSPDQPSTHQARRAREDSRTKAEFVLSR